MNIKIDLTALIELAAQIGREMKEDEAYNCGSLDMIKQLEAEAYNRGRLDMIKQIIATVEDKDDQDDITTEDDAASDETSHADDEETSTDADDEEPTDDIEFYCDCSIRYKGGDKIQMTKQRFRALKALWEAPGNIMTRVDFYNVAFETNLKHGNYIDPQKMKNLIYKIRKKDIKENGLPFVVGERKTSVFLAYDGK